MVGLRRPFTVKNDTRATALPVEAGIAGHDGGRLARHISNGRLSSVSGPEAR